MENLEIDAQYCNYSKLLQPNPYDLRGGKHPRPLTLTLRTQMLNAFALKILTIYTYTRDT